MSTDMTTPDNTGKTAESAEPAAAGAPMARMPQQPEGQQPEAATAKAITLREVHAYYGPTHAVRGVSLDYAANQVTGMIGPSGCGKSTLLRCINRMHEEIPGAYAEGQIELDGVDVYDKNVDTTAVRRVIGMVFQKPNPFPTMSIFDNVAAGLKLTGTRGVNTRERVEQSLRGAGLWEEVKDRLNQPGIGLSGGQQQRLCIARTIAVSPEVILMDEPCSALDPIATLKIEELMLELKERYTICIVTHNMQQAARASDVTAFFNLEASGMPGRLVEVGQTEKIFTRPDQKATEDYVSGRFG